MIYSLILRNKETVADFSDMEGDFHDYSMKVLKNINRNDEFTIVGNESYDFNFLIHEPYTFLAITNLNSNQEKILEFLQTLKNQFLELVRREKDNLMLASTTLLRELMNIYKNNMKYEKFDNIEYELEEIKVEIKKNLDKTIEKDYQIDSLLVKSENLEKSVVLPLNFSRTI